MKHIMSFNESVAKWKLDWMKDDSKRKLGDIVPKYEVMEMVSSFHESIFGDEGYDDTDFDERIEKYDHFKYEMININKIDLDEYSLDEGKIEDFVEYYKQHNDYPIIVVGEDEGFSDLTIIDGIHRANALERCGLNQIKAFVGYL